MLLLMEAQDGNWDEIDLMVRQFQGTTQALQQPAVPVVVAPAGLALGGGCEIALHGDRVQAAAESYIGLVEVGVGLIPAAVAPRRCLRVPWKPRHDVRRSPALRAAVFETIGFAKVSTSAAHAHTLGYLRSVDGVTMNRERLMTDAKALALDARPRWLPAAARRTAIPVGGESLRRR